MNIKVGSKIVGTVKNNTFKKKLIADKHFLRKPPSIAFDIASLLEAKYVGATKVEITETKTGDKYTSSIQQIFDKGFKFNRGYGNQIALILKEWEIKSERTSSNN